MQDQKGKIWLTLKCGRSLWVLALIRVYKQRQFPELSFDILYRRIESQIELLVRIELEGPQDPWDMI